LQSIIKESVALSGDADLMAASGKVAGMADAFAAMSAAAADNVDKAVAAGGDINAMMANIAQSQVTAQGDMADQMLAAAEGGDLSAMQAGFTGAAFDTAANKATIGDLDPNSTTDDAAAAASNTDAGEAETPTPPAGGGGGGGGGATPTFTVTETSGVVEFGGTATGDITISWSAGVGSVATFTREGVEATDTADFAGTATSITVADEDTLAATAADVTGMTINGDGTVAITALESTLGADLSSITAMTATADVTTAAATPLVLTGGFKFGQAAVAVSGDGFLVVDSADMGTASFNVGAGATLAGKHAQMTGLTIVGTGTASTELAANTDVSHYADTLTIQALVADNASINISANTHLGKVDNFYIGDDQAGNGTSNTLTMTATQANGKQIHDGSSSHAEHGNVVITGLAADTDLSGVAVTGTVTGTVTSSVDLTNVDLTKLTALTIDDDTNAAITATVSPQQYAVWHGTATLGTNDLIVSSDTTAPTVTTASAAYDEGSNTLTITGTNFATLLETGETVATDIKGRMDWTKLVWDINGDSTGTANVSFAASDISTAKVTDGTTLTVVLTSAKGTSLEGTTGYGATGNADTIDITAGFARDISGNAATTDALADGVNTITADTAAPTATVTTATIQPAGNAVVQSTETGTAYLVKDTVTVSDVASITSAADNNFNSATITTAATNTNLAATGLVDGTYKVYTVDAAGNLSAASTNSVTVDGTAPTTTISGIAISADTGASSSDFLTKTAAQTITGTLSTGLAVGETLMGSVDGGSTWADITSKVTTTAISWDGATLAGSSSIKMKVVDTAANGGTVATQAYVLDTTAPTAALSSPASVQFIDANKQIAIAGNYVPGGNWVSLLEAGENDTTDIKGRLDWSKIYWDIDGDSTTLQASDVGFDPSTDITSVNAQSSSLVITLSNAGYAALTSKDSYVGSTVDTLDIAAGFLRDSAGNTNTAAATNAAIAFYNSYADFSGTTSIQGGPENNQIAISAAQTGFAPTDDVVLGGSGTDQINLQETGGAVTLDLTTSDAAHFSGFEVIVYYPTNHDFSLTFGAYEFSTDATSITIAPSSYNDGGAHVMTINASALVADGVNASGAAGADVLTGSDQADTLTGNGGTDLIQGDGGVDTILLGAAGNSYTADDTATDTVVYAKSSDGGATGDVIRAFHAGASNGDILKFIDAGSTTAGALELTGTATKVFNKGTLSGLTATAADNVWIVTDAQATWTTAAAIDAAVNTKADSGMTGGLVLVFHTGASSDAEVWYLGTASGTTDGSDVVKLATLVGVTDLTTLTTNNFAIAADSTAALNITSATADIAAAFAGYSGTAATVNATSMDATQLTAVAAGAAKIAAGGLSGTMALTSGVTDANITTLEGKYAGTTASAVISGMSDAQITALDNAKIAANSITGAVTGLNAAALTALATKAVDIAATSLTGDLALTNGVTDANITTLEGKYAGTTATAVISDMSDTQITALDNAKIATDSITGAVTGLNAAALTALATKAVDIADASLTGDLAVANADFTAFSGIQSKLAATANVAISAVADGDTVTVTDFTNTSFTGTIAGTTGKFNITAGVGDQTITTGAGDDVIIGGAGADAISLVNGGNDVVAFTAATDGSAAGNNAGYDEITGFTTTVDKIQFGGTLFTALDDNSNAAITAVDRAQTNVDATADEMVLLSTALGTTFAADTSFAAFITAIGAINTGFTTGAEVLVVAVDSANNTGIYLITSANNDATVDAGEVQLLGVVNGTLAASAGDFILTSLV